jgi:hypothetical protein
VTGEDVAASADTMAMGIRLRIFFEACLSPLVNAAERGNMQSTRAEEENFILGLILCYLVKSKA